MLVFAGTSINGEMLAEARAAARLLKEMGCRAVHHDMNRRGDIWFWMADSSPVGSRNMSMFTGTSINGEMLAEAGAAARLLQELGCRPSDEFRLEDSNAMQSMVQPMLREASSLTSH